ncbi:MAG TPA: type II toxin-antitoxin system VapC family toxin, partial [Thermoanaerobaculia bacterium]|nr:type II toxin-antitoxin system VapC family toxin [Thermoanaerobaculia bacterium]
MAFVLDASALLAMLQGEPGGGFIEMVLENSVISAVNWGEVVQKSMARGVVTDGMRREVQALGLDIQPFLATDAERAAELWSLTRAAGLSLGDRACLAVAARLGLPALTTDRAWQGIAKA